ncbi:MAG: hypothetical protein HYR56_29805 [Acidobacteria bacterium]|nr:hypothetical protein [Acidobacteriota bacterium]MBI3421441.1 hypothetical protein [Acidobacteriota bacterium]
MKTGTSASDTRTSIKALVPAKRLLVALTLLFALAILSCQKLASPENARQAAQLRVLRGGEVHGFAAIGAGRQDLKIPPIRLPNIRVFLKNLTQNTATPKVATNTHGYFAIPRQQPGRYQLCLEGDGFISACDPAIISIAGETIVLDHDALIAPEPGTLRGTVLMGKPARWCYQESQQFGTLEAAKVSLVNSGGAVVAGPVTGNSFGQYVLPKVPAAGNYRLSAAFGGGVITRTVSLAAADLLGTSAFDITSTNSLPVILGLRATRGGQDVRSASPGEVLRVTVTATDSDRNRLHFKWADSNASLKSVDAPAIDWKLPSAPSTYIISVQVTDGKGGFATSRLTIRTGPNQVRISGSVTNRATGAPIDQAAVSVNGTLVKTNPAGAFLASVPESKRYVINVKKAAFALLSRAVYGPAAGLSLKLDQAQHATFDAGAGGRAVFERNNGAQVTIGPNTLVDARGNPASGPVHSYLFAYDLNQSNAIPGDGAAVYRGRNATMVSYGAIDATLTDGGGQPLRLAPGTTADIELTIHPPALATAPATIPLFTFDEARGIWLEDGTLTKVGNRYRGKVRHFSAFNADTVFSNTACIKLTVFDDPTNALKGAPAFPFKLHVSYTSSSGGPNHNDFQVTEKINGLFRLPPNTAVTLEIHPNSGPDAILQTLTVNSGLPDGSSDGFPPFPYGACRGFDPASTTTGQPVILSVDLPPHDVPYLGLPIIPPPLGSDPLDPTPVATAYYTSLGAIGATQRDTFSHWKATNGFNDDPTIPPVAGEANAVYYNNGDLQFGRDMHCRQQNAATGKAACYVSNYGTGPAGPAASAIYDAIHNKLSSVLATVAMEYDGTSNDDAVQFYAYKADGTLFKNPALDSELNKELPQLCLACHGGGYNSSTNKVEGASFLPFDVFSFVYDLVDGYTLSNQQEQFRQLNAIIAATHPNNTNANDPIVGLINGLYPCGVNNSGCIASDTPPVWLSGWSSNTDLYQNVVRKDCRTCHVAQPSYLDWTSLSQMTGGFKFSIQQNVCDPSTSTFRNHYMPHGEVPFKTFWFSTDPHSPKLLADPGTGLGLIGGVCQK